MDAWIDFNGDGDWDDSGEQILRNVEFSSGELTRTFSVRVPSTFPIPATGLDSFARFRTSSAGNLLPTGLALDGEVEDYAIRLIPGTAPVPTVDSYSIDEDHATGIVTTDATGGATPGFSIDDGVLANDVNASGLPIHARLITPPQHASGTFTLSDSGLFTYKPEPNFYGTDTFVYRTYVVVDAARGEIIESLTDTTVTIDVRPVNDAPVANNVTLTIDEHETLRLSTSELILRSNAAAGPANEASQTLTLTVPNSVSAQGGSLSVVAGELIYTPAPGFLGQDTFEFRLTDNGITGSLSDPRSVTRTLTVNIQDTNDAPTTVTKNYTTNEDTPLVRSVAQISAGDSPVEPGQTLTLTSVEAASLNGGTVVLLNGNVTYTPSQDYNGPDQFYYYVTDNDPTNPRSTRGTVNVTVTPVNDAPRVALPLGSIDFQEDGQERIVDLAQHFVDPDAQTGNETLTYRVFSNSNLSLVTINFTGDEMFVRPNPDANGTASVVIEARDSSGSTVTSTLTINVAAVGDLPRLVSPLPNLTVQEDQVIAPITLVPNHFMDPDVASNGDELRFTVDVSDEDLVRANIVNGRLQLSLVPDASGTASITVTAIDLAGNSVSDSFDLIVNTVNDGPIAVADVYYVQRGGLFTTTDATGNTTAALNDDGVLANDSDPESNTFTARVHRQPTHGTLTMRPDGTFTYQSNNVVPVGTIDTFEYEAVDQFGAVGNRVTVQINIGEPAPSTHQNPALHLDVTADGYISPIDVLVVVNFLNFNRIPSIPISELPPPPYYLDVNGDKFITPLDALAVINYLNARSNTSGGEGEFVGADLSSPTLSSKNRLIHEAVEQITAPVIVSSNATASPESTWTGYAERSETNALKTLESRIETSTPGYGGAVQGEEGTEDVFAYYRNNLQTDVEDLSELIDPLDDAGMESESAVDELFSQWDLD